MAQYLTQHPDDPAAATALVRAAAEPVLGAEPASQVTVTIWRAAGEVAVRAAAPWSLGPAPALRDAKPVIAARHAVADQSQAP
ncbi:MAG: hypothetical protein KKA73_03635 [Chloroflexi bacterium]|nr:hypothetical protein [Chloroflexota bacterium]